jgi:hypothetical protein
MSPTWLDIYVNALQAQSNSVPVSMLAQQPLSVIPASDTPASDIPSSDIPSSDINQPPMMNDQNMMPVQTNENPSVPLNNLSGGPQNG